MINVWYARGAHQQAAGQARHTTTPSTRIGETAPLRFTVPPNGHGGRWVNEMNEHRDRLMAWHPGASGYSRDETILAVGIQCSKRQFPIADVLAWLGVPDKATGNSGGGHLVYFFSGDAETAPIFDVRDGRVVEFGTITRFKPNATRPDGKTHFNVLDDMEPFTETAFR